MNIAIITGASSGMGRELVSQLHSFQSFDQIWVIARRLDRLNSLSDLNSDTIVPISLDLTDKNSISALKEKLDVEKPTVSLLVNASGFGKFGKFEDIPLDQNIGMIELNDIALVSVTYTVLPYMSENAKILNIGSMSSFEPIPYINVYAASKAFVLSFTRALNRELKKRKIHALCLCPYWVNTEFFNRANSDNFIKKFDYIYEPEFVIKKALKALYKSKKDYLVPGKYAKLLQISTKLLPHSFIMTSLVKMFKLDK